MKSGVRKTSVQSYSEVGDRVRRLRRDSKLTQADLAGQVGISSTHLCGVERGLQRPSASLLQRIAAVFSLTLDTLLDGLPFRPRRGGCTKLRPCCRELRAAFPRPRPRPRTATLRVAFREASFYRLGPWLLDRLTARKGMPARFWRALKTMAVTLNGAEQMVVLLLLEAGALLVEIHPHQLGYRRGVMQEPGRWWLGLALRLDQGWMVVFPQVGVDVRKGGYLTLDFLVALSYRGKVSFLDVEADGWQHAQRKDKDQERAERVGLATVRLGTPALDSLGFVPWLVKEVTSVQACTDST